MFQIIFSNLDNQFKVKRYLTIILNIGIILNTGGIILNIDCKCNEFLGIRYYP